MDRKIALKWARALESGEYEQGTGQLRNGNAFCCLGVLCNLHAQEHPEIAAEQLDPAMYLGAEAVLPERVMYWADMRSDGGGFLNSIEITASGDKPYAGAPDTHWIRDLIELNDEHQLDFKQIAKVIRAHSDKL